MYKGRAVCYIKNTQKWRRKFIRNLQIDCISFSCVYRADLSELECKEYMKEKSKKRQKHGIYIKSYMPYFSVSSYEMDFSRSEIISLF